MTATSAVKKASHEEASSLPLEIRSVSKSFGSQLVLKEVSFSLIPGEIFGLIGLNGVGKTTLIKIMLDLAKADRGEVHIFGTDSHQVAARRNLSYLPEKFQPSRYLTGMEYLRLSLSYFGRKLDEQAARLMATKLDLNPDKLSSKVGSYSKGMGQKLGLVSAFLLHQPLLVLDEPMSGLDPSARIKLKNVILQKKEEGATIFFSSHILADIDEICDRIAVIHGAKILYLGTPAAFKPAYKETSLEKAFLRAIEAV